MSDKQPPPGPIFQRLDRRQPLPYSAREYLARFAWEWVQRLLIRPSPRRADGWRRFWLKRFGAKLAPTSRVRPSASIIHPWLLTMGEHSLLADRVRVYNLGPVRLGDHTVVSQDASICAGTHDYHQPHLPLLRQPIDIGSGVWVCAEAFIGPDVTVGDNSIVGARAVVIADVPPGAIVAGNPAKVVKQRPLPDAVESAE